MSWVTDIGYAAAFIGGGILLGWLLFQFYVYRERLDIRHKFPERYRQPSFLLTGLSGILTAYLIGVNYTAGVSMLAITVIHLVYWVSESEKRCRTESAEVDDG